MLSPLLLFVTHLSLPSPPLDHSLSSIASLPLRRRRIEVTRRKIARKVGDTIDRVTEEERQAEEEEMIEAGNYERWWWDAAAAAAAK